MEEHPRPYHYNHASSKIIHDYARPMEDHSRAGNFKDLAKIILKS